LHELDAGTVADDRGDGITFRGVPTGGECYCGERGCNTGDSHGDQVVAGVYGLQHQYQVGVAFVAARSTFRANRYPLPSANYVGAALVAARPNSAPPTQPTGAHKGRLYSNHPIESMVHASPAPYDFSMGYSCTRPTSSSSRLT